MIVFISGKITGYPNYKEKFKKAEEELTSKGHIVINPSMLPLGLEKHEDYMHICYSMIDVCEAVYFLRDWIDSVGAVQENVYAYANNKVMLYEKTR